MPQSEQRLTDAIETITEGFSLYDNAGPAGARQSQICRAVRSWRRCRPRPARHSRRSSASAVAHGLIQDAKGRDEGWLRQRLAEHRHPGEPLLQRRSDGRWLQISERRTETGGTVAVYSDLTEVKESEQRAAAANQLILQSLRYASRIQSAVLPARRELDERRRRSFPDLGAARHRRRRFLLVPAHQGRLCRDGRRLHRPRRAGRVHDA